MLSSTIKRLPQRPLIPLIPQIPWTRSAMVGALLPGLILALGACDSDDAPSATGPDAAAGAPDTDDSAEIRVAGKDIRAFNPVLPATAARTLPVDPQLGYHVSEVKDNLYVVTDGVWQSVFLTTGAGVIVFDAPQSYGARIPDIVREQTEEPITHLVYSHAHLDHIGGSAAFADIAGLEIVAHERVADYLVEIADPARLIPTATFSGDFTLSHGDEVIEMSDRLQYHSNEADLFIYFPQQKFLYAVDSLTPGWVTFQYLDLTTNVHAYLKLGKEILSYDFDLFSGGHLTQLGTLEEVQASIEYTDDLVQVSREVFEGTDMLATMGEAGAQAGFANPFLLFRYYQERMIAQCSERMLARWQDRLSGVDVWVDGHCDKLLSYHRVD